MSVPEDSVPTAGALPAVGPLGDLGIPGDPGDLYGSGPPAAMAHSCGEPVGVQARPADQRAVDVGLPDDSPTLPGFTEPP